MSFISKQTKLMANIQYCCFAKIIKLLTDILMSAINFNIDT